MRELPLAGKKITWHIILEEGTIHTRRHVSERNGLGRAVKQRFSV